MTELFWAWYNNGWHLVKCVDTGERRIQPVEMDDLSAVAVWESEVIMGPLAGKLEDAPDDRPVYNPTPKP